ncbi:MAG: helix-turn-helix domain-containing protein [Chitinophagaceae bacterium]|nr:MAG: helix-turn-helix domain-containing protein [Chitinophagaceae bacterium]
MPMGKKISICLKFVFMAFLLIIAGCKSNKNNIVIGFSQCTGEDGWRRSQLAEMHRELAFYSHVTFLYKDAMINNETQIQQIKDLLKQHIDVLIVSPNEAQPLTPIINKVYQKGIPVIVVDRKTSSNQYTTYVGANNYQIGFLAGQYAGRLLNGKGKIVEIQGLPGSTPAIARHHGFTDALKKFPGVQIIAEVYTDWTDTSASAQIEKIKPIAKEANLVFGQNDVMAHAAYLDYKLWGSQSNVKFIGVDASPGPNLGLAWVSQGILTASVLYPTGGKEAIDAAIQAAKGKKISKDIMLHTLVIDSTNVGLMKLQSDKILSQQNDIERQQDLISSQLKIYKSQRNLLYVLLATLIIAILSGGIAYLSFRRNKRITQSLRLKNKEIVFQQNKLIEFSNQAKEATEAKLNFFTNISHEFRTPLTLIFGAIDDMTGNKEFRGNSRNQLNMVRKNALRLFRMVNQLIDYRKIDVKKMKLQASERDIVAFLDDIVSSFREMARKRNIDLRFSSTQSQIPLWFDPYMLDKVFFNLLSNAFKFTEDYGRITFSIAVDYLRKIVLIEIDDNGQGVPVKEAAHIFEPFYQGKSNTGKGFGLGLPLATEFIKLHHGSLSLMNKKQPGASFQVVLPLGSHHLSSDEIKNETIEVTNKDVSFPIDELSEADIENSTLPQEDSYGIKDISILIIEDNEDLLTFLSGWLGKKYEIYKSHDGEKGLQMAFEVIPDIIITDIVMPNKDGLNLTEMIKSNIRTSHIPVILLTARGSEENQIRGMQSMADYYIIKPFSLHFLDVVITALIKNRELMKEHFSADYDLEPRQDKRGNLERIFLSELNAFVEENMDNENLNVDDLCKHIGVSRIQLYRKVKALLGCSVNDFILNKRLTKAKFLLSQKEIQVSEVAFKVGFSSASYFSTAFKKKFNVSPKNMKP